MTGPSEQNFGITSGERSSMHGDSGWLERRAQNLGMAESKSTWFALSINAHSEKSRRFDLNGYQEVSGYFGMPGSMSAHLGTRRPGLHS